MNSDGAVILDVDGTLVDTNYQHALAWFRAFREHGLILPLWRLHRHTGMGGDQLVAAVAGDEVEGRLGDAIREAEGTYYRAMIDEVEPLEGARELLVELRSSGRPSVLASSAKAEELNHYLDLLGARDLVDAWTDASDVAATKPKPDLIQAALQKVSQTSGVMVGDSVYDCEAAARAGIRSLGVLTGGFSREELLGAGAEAVCESVDELHDALLPTATRPSR
jgi:HAD superfamily hydrolase (TIGR01509 family)